MTKKVTAVAVVVADASGKAIPGTVAYLKAPELVGGFLFAITNDKGYALWPEVPVPFTGVLQLAAAAAPYGSSADHGGEPVNIPDGNNITIRVGPTPANPQDVQLPPASFRKAAGGSPTINGRLRGNGPRLFDNSGPWKWKMATGFDALRLLITGGETQLLNYLHWIASIRGNGIRVFCNWKVTGLDFRQVPDYFAWVRRLAVLTKNEGMRVELCAVCDFIPESLTDEQAFINAIAEVCSEFEHMVLVFGNEPYQNMQNPEWIVKPGFEVLMARGMCNPNDPAAVPYLPSAGFTTYQTVRSDDWMRKVGKDGMEIRNGFGDSFPGTHDATVNTEMMGAAETYQPGRRSNRPDEFFMAGVAAAMFNSGATAHGDSQTMQWCVVPGEIEAKCASELFRGIDIVPSDAPVWDYARYGPAAPGVPMPVEPDPIDGDGDNVRIHAKVGDTMAVAVNYRYLLPGHDAWKPKGVNGWHVVEQDGSYVRCER
jgi:hypothetical protein